MPDDYQAKRNAALLLEARLEAQREARREQRKTQKYGPKPAKGFGYSRFAALRLGEINRLIEHWYGGPLSNDKDGKRITEIVANHIAMLNGSPKERLDRWAEEYAPWLSMMQRNTLVARYAGKPPRWKADRLAAALRLTMADRTICRIKTIGAIDCDKTQRAELRKQKRRERERLRRQAKKMLKAVTG